MTEQLDGQMCFLEEPETETLRIWHRLCDPEQYTRTDSYAVEKLPDGSEVIVAELGRDYQTGGALPEKNRYFRTIIKHYPGKFYVAHRLYVEPTQEWPGKARWQAERDGTQFCYVDHGWMYAYFVRRDAENGQHGS